MHWMQCMQWASPWNIFQSWICMLVFGTLCCILPFLRCAQVLFPSCRALSRPGPRPRLDGVIKSTCNKRYGVSNLAGTYTSPTTHHCPLGVNLQQIDVEITNLSLTVTAFTWNASYSLAPARLQFEVEIPGLAIWIVVPMQAQLSLWGLHWIKSRPDPALFQSPGPINSILHAQLCHHPAQGPRPRSTLHASKNQAYIWLTTCSPASRRTLQRWQAVPPNFRANIFWMHTYMYTCTWLNMDFYCWYRHEH